MVGVVCSAGLYQSSPVKHRKDNCRAQGFRVPNSPYNLDYTLGHLAKAFNLPPCIMARILNENVAQLYNLPAECWK